MHYLVRLLAVFALFCGVAQAKPAFVEGTHYTVIAQKADKSGVTEYFSYKCPHCFKSQPMFNRLKDSVKGKAKYTRTPVTWALGGSIDEAERLAEAYYAARALGKERSISTAIWFAIYQDRKPVKTKKELRDIFAEQGVSRNQFDKTFKSFQVQAAVKKGQASPALRSKSIRALPALVVNGKYLVNLGKAKSQKDLNQLVAFLLKQK